MESTSKWQYGANSDLNYPSKLFDSKLDALQDAKSKGYRFIFLAKLDEYELQPPIPDVREYLSLVLERCKKLPAIYEQQLEEITEEEIEAMEEKVRGIRDTLTTMMVTWLKEIVMPIYEITDIQRVNL